MSEACLVTVSGVLVAEAGLLVSEAGAHESAKHGHCNTHTGSAMPFRLTLVTAWRDGLCVQEPAGVSLEHFPVPPLNGLTGRPCVELQEP